MIGLALVSLVMLRSMIRAAPARPPAAPSLPASYRHGSRRGTGAEQHAADRRRQAAAALPGRRAVAPRRAVGTGQGRPRRRGQHPQVVDRPRRLTRMNARTRNPRSGIRKAAILVASLDQAAADALLDQMGPSRPAAGPPGDGRPGRRSIPREQQRVIDEFFRIGPLMPQEAAGRASNSTAGWPASWPCPGRSAAPTSEPPADDGPPFHFLHETEADKLAACAGRRASADDRPGALPPAARAGRRRARAPAAGRCRSRSSAGWSTWRRPTRRSCARWSAGCRRGCRSRSACSAAAWPGCRPWPASSRPPTAASAVQILDNLAAHDQPLAERLGPPPLAFDDLADLDDASLAAVFRRGRAGAG